LVVSFPHFLQHLDGALQGVFSNYFSHWGAHDLLDGSQEVPEGANLPLPMSIGFSLVANRSVTV
jgi:hypothetical protein